MTPFHPRPPLPMANDPERAALAVLDFTLAMAQYALIAANAEVHRWSFPYQGGERARCAAELMVTLEQGRQADSHSQLREDLRSRTSPLGSTLVDLERRALAPAGPKRLPVPVLGGERSDEPDSA